MAERSVFHRILYAVLEPLVQLLAVLAYRARYTGMRNIPAKGGVLVISNHQSHFDPPLVGMGTRRQMRYLARSSLFGFAPFRWLTNALGAVPIDRDRGGLAGIKESLRLLKRGEMLVMFPEGTRTRNGDIGTFHPGFTMLAVRSGAAILPVAIEGAFVAWPRWHKLPRLGRIHVHYGAPLLPNEIASLDEQELMAEVERRVRECHARLRQHPIFVRRAAAKP